MEYSWVYSCLLCFCSISFWNILRIFCRLDRTLTGRMFKEYSLLSKEEYSIKYSRNNWQLILHLTIIVRPSKHNNLSKVKLSWGFENCFPSFWIKSLFWLVKVFCLGRACNLQNVPGIFQNLLQKPSAKCLWDLSWNIPHYKVVCCYSVLFSMEHSKNYFINQLLLMNRVFNGILVWIQMLVVFFPFQWNIPGMFCRFEHTFTCSYGVWKICKSRNISVKYKKIQST